MTLHSGPRSLRRSPPVADQRDLPLYVVGPDGPTTAAPPRPARSGPGPAGSRLLAAVARRSARAHGVGPGAGPVESSHRMGFSVTRYLLAPPAPSAAAYDDALTAMARRIRTGPGTLVVGVGRRQPEPAGGQLRVVRCRLWLRTSPVPVPVEMELLPLGQWRAVLHLRLARRFVRTMGWHRRRAYFAAGNATVDRLHRAVEGRLRP